MSRLKSAAGVLSPRTEADIARVEGATFATVAVGAGVCDGSSDVASAITAQLEAALEIQLSRP